MAGDKPVGPFRHTRKRAEEDGQHAAPGKQPGEGCSCCAAREETSVGSHEMPGIEAGVRSDRLEQSLTLIALNLNRA